MEPANIYLKLKLPSLQVRGVRVYGVSVPIIKFHESRQFFWRYYR